MKPDATFALENAGWPALLLDEASTVLRANGSAVRLLGSALEGASAQLGAIWAAGNALPADQFLAHWERSPAPTVSLKFRIRGGNVVAFTAWLSSFTRDEQRFFLLQLPPDAGQAADGSAAHKQKLDCALQLARTVSLDFNNALTSVLGHTSFVLSKMEVNHPWRASLLEVEKSAAKAAEIANDLGTFSRQDKEARTQAAGNLNELLQRTVEFFQHNAAGQEVAWSLLFERRLYTTKFDEAKLQQVFIKILENSLQAIAGKGRITVQTRNLELTVPTQDRNVHLAAGAYVCAEITDNGCGIGADVLPRIFEPFFTTKKTTGHRGLGLAWVYGIVTNHGGGVAVSSQPGVGTSVRVYLPAEAKVVHESPVTWDDLRGDQTILVVDDEDLLLTVAETILTGYGYRVITANSAQRALEVLSKNDRAVDLVMTDLVMPGMSGRELVETIQQQWPGLRVLLSSGYARPVNSEEGINYLQKPFTSQEMLLKVKQILSSESS